MIRNFIKISWGDFIRLDSKIAAMTIMQYVKYDTDSLFSSYIHLDIVCSAVGKIVEIHVTTGVARIYHKIF